MDARRDIDPQLADRALRPAAGARRARILDHGAGTVAVGARLGDGEDALALGFDTAALTDRTDLRAGPGLGARSLARRTRRRGRHRQRHLGAVDRLVERQRDLGLEVAAALCGAPSADAALTAAGALLRAAASAEQVGEDVAEAAAERTRVKATAATGREPERAGAAVVGLALVGIGQDVVRLRDLLETLLGLLVARIAVGVVLARELAVGLLDLLVGGVLAYAEDLVVVGALRHRGSSLSRRRRRAPDGSRTRPANTRAGRPRRPSPVQRPRPAAARSPRGAGGRTSRR